MMSQLKYKYSRKSMNETVKTLNNLQNGLSSKEVASKENDSKSTLSTWLINKGKMLKS